MAERPMLACPPKRTAQTTRSTGDAAPKELEANMQRVPHFVALMFAASASVGGWGALVAQESPSAAAFGSLASLVGHWKGGFRGTDIRLTYTLPANGSALMEESRPKSEPAMITMFTVDGDHLLATHYCSTKN